MALFAGVRAGLCVANLFHHICFPAWLSEDLVSSLSDALIIAGLLGWLLELFATRLLIEKISSDLADKLVGRGLPSELQSLIRTIVDTDLVRDHFVKTYQLAPIDGADQLYVNLTNSWEVKNYSDKVVLYAPKLEEEMIYDFQLLSLEYGLRGKERFTETIEKSDPATRVKTMEGKDKIKLEPLRRNEGAVCEVTMRYRLTMPMEYSDVTSFGGATMGATLRAEKVSEFEVVSSDYTTVAEPSKGDKSWYFDRPFVSGQHIRVRWFPKKNSTK